MINFKKKDTNPAYENKILGTIIVMITKIKNLRNYFRRSFKRINNNE